MKAAWIDDSFGTIEGALFAKAAAGGKSRWVAADRWRRRGIKTDEVEQVPMVKASGGGSRRSGLQDNPPADGETGRVGREEELGESGAGFAAINCKRPKEREAGINAPVEAVPGVVDAALGELRVEGEPRQVDAGRLRAGEFNDLVCHVELRAERMRLVQVHHADLGGGDEGAQ